jgi:hypothetical protein
MVNQATQPILMSDSSTGTLLSLGHLLKSTVQILIQPYCSTCQIPPTIQTDVSALQNLPPSADLFFFNPVRLGSQAWLQMLEQDPAYQLNPVVYSTGADGKNRPTLWRVNRL